MDSILSGLVILAFLCAVFSAVKAVKKNDLTLWGATASYTYTAFAGVGVILFEDFPLLPLHIGVLLIFVSALISYLSPFLFKVQIEKLSYANAIKQLKNMTDKYFSLVENSPVGFYVIDEYGRIEYINKFLAKILGYDVSEVIGKSIYNYIQDDFKELVEKNIYKKISGEVKSTSYEIVMLKKGGEPVKLRTFGNRTENGHVTITGSIIELED